MFEFALSGITPYNRSVYFSLLQDYNLAMWPAHIIAIILAVYLIYELTKANENSARKVMFILGISWIVVGYYFFLKTYLSINWAGQYFAYAFVLQGILCLFLGLFFNVRLMAISNQRLSYALYSILAMILLLYPWAGFIDGKSVAHLEVFALSPDITVLFSLMFLTLIKEQWKYVLLPIPIIWLVISFSSAITLKLFQWQIMSALLIVWIILIFIHIWGDSSHP